MDVKPPLFLLLGLVIAMVTFTIEEIRISQIRQKLAQLESQSPDHKTDRNPIRRVQSTKPRHSSESDRTRELGPNSPTPILIQQGLRVSIPNLYGNFIARLDLNSEENDYLESLLLGRLLIQHQFGANYTKASAPARPSAIDDFNVQIADNDLKIKRFLNHPDDYADFARYEKKLPERRNLDEIRAFISPLSPDTEDHLVDLLYHCRIETEGDLEAWETLVPLENLATKRNQWMKCDERLAQIIPTILPDRDSRAFLQHWNTLRNTQKKHYHLAHSLVPH